MFNLRCTAKLLRRLKCQPQEAAESDTCLGDWYANVFFAARQPVVIFTSERALLSVLVPAREARQPAVALVVRLRPILSELGIQPPLIDAELARMESWAIAATTNRSVLGSMNDFIAAAKWHIEEQGLALDDVQRRLAETPMKVLQYRFPREVATELLIAR